MNELLETPFIEPFYFVLMTAIISGVTFTRYVIISGLWHYLFHQVFRERFQQRIINEAAPKSKQIKSEIFRSAITSLIFGVSGTVMVILWQMGIIRIYTDWSEYPVWYHPFSLIAMLLLHETYYYWLHRWMHRPRIYRLVHKWHHDSIKTSSMTSFSFHPIESVLQAIVVPVLLLIFPLHLYLLFALLMIMTISGTLNHASVELFPKGFEKHWLGKWLVGATHHDLHHRRFRYNYGLYFTFWDRWMDTESPEFEEKFREHTGG